MSSVHSFIAQQVPRYGVSEIQAGIYENRLGQRALWSGLAFLVLTQGNFGIELRFTSSRNRGVEITISLMDHDGRAIDPRVLRQVEQLLPAEYRWISGSSHFDDVSSEDDKWRIARVLRRLEYVDLPYHSLLLAQGRRDEANFANRRAPGSESAAATKIDGLNRAGATGLQGAGTMGNLFVALHSAMSNAGQRFLPETNTQSNDLLRRRYCLPLLGPIDAVRPRSRRLLEELLEVAPAAISICFWPVSLDEAREARVVAGNLQRFLAPFAAELSNSGFAEFGALRSVYDRYFLPETYLLRTSIRVAAKQDDQAIGVATLVGATFGGLRAFQIRPPSQDVSLQLLRRSDLDLPLHPLARAGAPERDRWVRRCEQLLQASDVALPGDESLQDFLVRLPHIYSLEEVEQLAQLPVSDDEGLPGLDSRPIPPFAKASRIGNYPSLTAEGQIASPPKDRLRIGIDASLRAAFPSSGSLSGATDGEWHTLSTKDLTKHSLIVGSTGSGKTVTTTFLIRELARLSIPFLIIEPVKTEYFDNLQKALGPQLQRRRLEGDNKGRAVEDFLAFDPMRLQPGVSVARHASYLKSCFEAAFPLDPVLSMILDAGIRAYYTEGSDWGCKLDVFSRGGVAAHRVVEFQNNEKPNARHRVVHPSLRGFREFFLKRFLPKAIGGSDQSRNLSELRETWTQLFRRRFDALMSGMIGKASEKADRLFLANPTQFNPFDDLLIGQKVLELDGVPDNEHKALLMAFVMTFLFERRQADDLGARESGTATNDNVKHVLVIEEAHRLLTNSSRGHRGDVAGADAQGKSVSLFVDMLAEIRAFGQGLIIVEQIPTKIVPEAVKNTNLKIMLRLTAADDREFLGTAMNFTEDQKRFVTSLRAEQGRGVDMVVFEQQLDQPRLLTLPLPHPDGSPLHQALFVPSKT
jgi:Helicase HerA, central domain